MRRSLTAQIAEVEREIALRRNVYPRLVRQGKMREGEADERMRIMGCVLETLQWLGAHRDDVAALRNKEVA